MDGSSLIARRLLAGRRLLPADPRAPGGPIPGRLPARVLTPLLLRRGDEGEAVRDLQQRLAAQGHAPAGDDGGRFGDATEAAVRSFQERRGLRVDGMCGPQTWGALVEAGFRLGERLLYLREPMLRGDDVADLQRRLGALGFDAGRVDGIFGSLTVGALTDFQRNAGITVDGIGGPDTLVALTRLGRRDSDADLPELVSVNQVREQERLRQGPRTLAGRQIGLGHEGEIGLLIAAVRRSVAGAGALAVPLQQADGSAQAAAANLLALDLYLGFALTPDAACTTAYWRSPNQGEESTGGRRLAELLQERLPAVLDAADGGAHGMALDALRETRMPAVICTLGSGPAVAERARGVAEAVADALRVWAASPC